jgi:D-beta-D-heptose 7-phosphate kinase/D-beta-D-heptose 1-phosphate adenosyltransferase
MYLLEGRSNGPARDAWHSVSEQQLAAASREVADVTGAGDTVIGTMALALASGATLSDAARLANYAAGVAVSRFGPVPVTAAELRAAVAQQAAG